ncbi:MAG: ybeY [Holophagaceae bacterium]|nr:ybeY [Holophagaceae bacterium]
MDGKAVEFKVDWSTRSKLRGPGERSLGALLEGLRQRLAPHAEGLSISYVDDRIMRKLNREHRGINQTTDVLSFPAEPEKGAFQHLGDLVVSLPVAEKMAKKLGVSRKREVETLVIHGFLHLCGYDHETDAGEMLQLQAQLERELLEEEPLPMSLKRGRKPGSKIKVLKSGSRVVVTGRAAKALVRSQEVKKVKPVKKAAEVLAPKAKSTRGPGRPRKVAAASVVSAPVTPAKRPVKRKRPALRRSGVIS